jgi:hypothetical protein
LLIAFPNADDPPSGNHESLESKIPKRKKARPNTRLSCKIEYFIETTSAYRSGRSAFFTDDCVFSMIFPTLFHIRGSRRRLRSIPSNVRL